MKIALEKPDIEVVAINDLTDSKTLAYLLKYDTAYGVYEKDVKTEGNDLVIEGKKIQVLAEKDPSALPWGKLGIDVVLECTGKFTSREEAGLHIKAGAKKVVISAPSKGDNPAPTFVLGVNADELKSEDVINNASCTTNGIVPVMAVLEEKFGIAKALMTTVHAYTHDQNLQDAPHKDLRRARAAAANIVPTSTGAAIAATEAIPTLKNKFDGVAIRVPVITGSLSDITASLKKSVTPEEVNAAFKEAANSDKLKGILTVSEDPIVSSDIIGNPASTIIDLQLTQVVGGDLVKVFAWYDNEWGYSNRLVEMAIQISQSEPKPPVESKPVAPKAPVVQPPYDKPLPDTILNEKPIINNRPAIAKPDLSKPELPKPASMDKPELSPVKEKPILDRPSLDKPVTESPLAQKPIPNKPGMTLINDKKDEPGIQEDEEPQGGLL